MLLGHLHKLDEVLVMVPGGMVIDHYAKNMVCYLVHSHLKDILGHFQTKRHMQEPVSAMMGIKHGQV